MNTKPSGLGRGLNSLIPNKKIKDLPPPDPKAVAPIISQVTEEALGKEERIQQLPIHLIVPNPHQPRSDFNQEELNDLVESIKEHGILQPLIVVKAGDSGWQLIAGERRWRSAKILGLETVPAIVRNLSEQKKLEVALIENLQRKDLNALEVAIAYKKLIDEFNLTQEQLAKRVGKSRSQVANFLRILSALPQVQAAIREGKIFEGHARVLAGLPEEDQLALLKKILAENLSVRETEKSGREVVVKKHIRKVNFDPEIKAREEELQRSLGTKVEIKKSGSQGQIIIKFFSEEELEEIYRKIV